MFCVLEIERELVLLRVEALKSGESARLTLMRNHV
jgi:hypothetical protein